MCGKLHKTRPRRRGCGSPQPIDMRRDVNEAGQSTRRDELLGGPCRVHADGGERKRALNDICCLRSTGDCRMPCDPGYKAFGRPGEKLPELRFASLKSTDENLPLRRSAPLKSDRTSCALGKGTAFQQRAGNVLRLPATRPLRRAAVALDAAAIAARTLRRVDHLLSLVVLLL